MKDVWVDVCLSEGLKDVRVAEHEAEGRTVTHQEQIAFGQAALVKGRARDPEVVVRISQEDDDLWLVIAEKEAES